MGSDLPLVTKSQLVRDLRGLGVEAGQGEFLAAGHGRTGQVGAARSYLLDAATLCRFAVGWMERTFGARRDG